MNLTETGKLGGAQGSLGLGLERQGRKRKKELTERGRGMANSWRCEKCREIEKEGGRQSGSPVASSVFWQHIFTSSILHIPAHTLFLRSVLSLKAFPVLSSYQTPSITGLWPVCATKLHPSLPLCVLLTAPGHRSPPPASFHQLSIQPLAFVRCESDILN